METLKKLADDFEIVLKWVEKSRGKKRATNEQKLQKSIDALMKAVKPTETDLKGELAIHPDALKVKELYDEHKKEIDLKPPAAKVGIKAKNPNINKLLVEYYYPVDRVHELVEELETIVAGSPEVRKKKQFMEWRGKLRSLESEKQMSQELERLMDQHGIKTLREFAAYLGTKKPSSKQKLAKNASASLLIEAVTKQLWKEKQTSRAHEGRS